MCTILEKQKNSIRILQRKSKNFLVLAGVTLRINIKMFNGKNLPYELLLTARQKPKMRNAFSNNMSTDMKLSKT